MLGLVAGYATGHANRIIRLAVPTAIGAFAGWLIGTSLLFRNRPDASIVQIVLLAIVGATVLAGISFSSANATCSSTRVVRRSGRGHRRRLVASRPRLRLGFHGDHRRRHPLALLGLRFGWPSDRREWARLIRPAVPCGDLPRPALTFLSINLVVPAVRTILTSFLTATVRSSSGSTTTSTSSPLRPSSTGGRGAGRWHLEHPDEPTHLVRPVLIVAGIGIAYSINWTRNRTSASTTPRPLGARWRRLLPSGVRLLLGDPRHVLQHDLVDVHRHDRCHGARPRDGGALAASRSMGEHRQVAGLHADGHLDGRRIGHLATPVRPEEHQRRTNGCAERRVDCARQAEQRRTRRQTYPAWSRWLLLLVLAALLVRLGFRIFGSWQRSEGFAGATVALIVVGWLFVEFLTRSMGASPFSKTGRSNPRPSPSAKKCGRSTTST